MTDEIAYPMQRGCPFHPPEKMTRLQKEDPFARVKIWDGTEPYLLTRYVDIRSVLSNAGISTNANVDGYPHILEGRMVSDKADKSFIRKDPPEHTRLRRMVMREFTVKRVEELRPKMQAMVDRLIANFAKLPQGADFVEHFAAPLPTEVITLLLGVPYSDSTFFHEATRVQFSLSSTQAEVRKSLDDLFAYLDALITRKERDPQDDIVSRLVHEQMIPGNIDRAGLISTLRLLLSAGHQTTQNTAALGVLLLLQHPAELAKLKADPGLALSAVDEILRYTTVLHLGARRVAAQDIDVNGHRIEAGAGIICAIPAANRDAEMFPDPDRFDISRDAAAHVAFGFGIHQCLGQVLARTELQIVFESLFKALPDLRLAVPFERINFRSDMFIYGVHELPLNW